MCSVLLYCLLPLKGFAKRESTVIFSEKMGFENVGWTEDGNERVYVLQNSAYRLQGVSIGKRWMLSKDGFTGRKVMPNNSSGQ